ncbi:MAG: hypothetical protein LBI45_08485 [Bacteroidales bacterium]|jgi:WD40 repeat protein|nr:hypothetical protein [Bacteroidales bacterium]
MKLFRIIFSAMLCFATSLAIAQTQIPNAKADFITLDPYGNIYAVKETLLSKYSPQGNFLFSYSNHTLGVISSIDVFNPMKIMLFYRDAGTLVFLNEQLSIINDPISLFDVGYFTISLASYSAANQIHLYDNTNKYLHILDFNFKEIATTPIALNSFNPLKMIELEEKGLAFHDPKSGIYLFDAFGTFDKHIPIITNDFPVNVTSELIYSIDTNSINFYNYRTMQSETRNLPFENIVQLLYFRNHKIILQQDGTIWIY